MDAVNVGIGQSITAGQIIGKNGTTGNAASKDVPNKHVHIQARRLNSGVWQKADPEDYIYTKFDNQGNPINNPCGN